MLRERERDGVQRFGEVPSVCKQPREAMNSEEDDNQEESVERRSRRSAERETSKESI